MTKPLLATSLLTLFALLPLAIVAAQSYQSVKTFTGSSDLTTDYFNVPTGEWRITWSYTPNPSYSTLAVFSVFAYPKGETTMFTSSIMEFGDNTTSGVTYVHEKQGGDYYLKIGAANIADYSITIEAVSGSSPSPSIPEYPAVLTIIALVALGAVTTVLFKKRGGS